MRERDLSTSIQPSFIIANNKERLHCIERWGRGAELFLNSGNPSFFQLNELTSESSPSPGGLTASRRGCGPPPPSATPSPSLCLLPLGQRGAFDPQIEMIEMIYKGSGFLAVVWFGSTPNPFPPLLSANLSSPWYKTWLNCFKLICYSIIVYFYFW
jgi:hypothetical protein